MKKISTKIHRLWLLNISLLVATTGCTSAEQAFVESPADYVNPFIGATCQTDAAGSTHGLGKTIPGAFAPFGMVQVSPNTITGKDKSSGYSYECKTIEGFALTQMSGVGWFGDLGNLLIMPTTGDIKTVPGKEDGSVKGWRSAYDKSSEKAEAGYYTAFLTDYGIKAETSATEHCGALRFTFPENRKSRIQIDLARRIAGTSDYQEIKVVNDTTIEGWIKCTPDGGGWGNGKGQVRYNIYFHGVFSKPMAGHGFWSADIPDNWTRKRDDVISVKYQKKLAEAKIINGGNHCEGKSIGFFAEFPTADKEAVTLKVGISFVDQEGALKNYNAEILDKDFDAVRKYAYDRWNEELDRVRISGGTEDEKTVFYTAMYRTMLDPRLFADVDGRYVGGDYKIHQQDPKFIKRTIFSGWDVFRSQMPLQTIINPELVSDVINSLTTMAEESGREYYERWEFFNAYSGCMIGNPALSVIADAYVKGIESFDAEKAYGYCKNTSKLFGNDKYGYSFDDRSRGISLTLEYAYFDWCIAQLAKALGKDNEAELYVQKSKAYKNIWDSEMKWFRNRLENGEFDKMRPQGRLQQGWGCTESNPYQQGWFVPHDLEGMCELMGGREAVLADLTDFFEKAPEDFRWNNYYNHANEPVHLIPFYFNKLQAPWLTQKWTRHICTHAYANEVEQGIIGNEDAGQMSAWYILAASGIHPSCPGETRMEITSPVFDRIEFNLDNRYAKGDKFTVIAHNNSDENIYIQKAVLNGKEYNKCWIDFADIAAGSTLELYMGNEPSKTWGIN